LSAIPQELRERVAARAKGVCEYCRMPQSATLYKHEPDHIVPRQHGGETNPDNLALACMRCNRYKGPNVGSFDPASGRLEPLFNPRTQSWNAHFALRGGVIEALTPEARVTAKILRFNDAERVAERRRLIAVGLL
jgi:5-methylcytosine-specific restriction endonuclease McrA